MLQGFLTTRQASRRSGISDAHLRRLLASGVLRGVRVGRDWLIEESSLEHYLAHRPRPGRKPRRRRARPTIEKVQEEG